MICLKCKEAIQEKCGYWKGRTVHLGCLEKILEGIASRTSPLMETLESLESGQQFGTTWTTI